MIKRSGNRYAKAEHEVRVQVDKTQYQNATTAVDNCRVRTAVNRNLFCRDLLNQIVLDQHIHAGRQGLAIAVPNIDVINENVVGRIILCKSR